MKMTKIVYYLSIVSLFVFLSVVPLVCASETQNICSFDHAVTTDGFHRLALVVGVGKYKSEKVRSLSGPPNDARRIYELLTGKNGYGFPKENVCLLLDERATTANFVEAFNKGLIDRAGAKDVVVFYFAGHGSQRCDQNGDEPDEWDETLMFHDSFTSGMQDFLDDDLNELLARLRTKTENIIIISDSCNAGTMDRGPEGGTFVSRYHPPERMQCEKIKPNGKGEGAKGWVPESIPGIVVLSAATDGTSALERGGRGVFTDALLEVLAQTGNQPLTYAQAARQIPAKISSVAYQIPMFQGDLDKPVFGNTKRARPVSWEVISEGTPLKLGGPPLPGISKGAEMRIYPGSAIKAETKDPQKAIATVIIDEMTGLNALAHVTAARPGAPKIAKGDLAVLARTADKVLSVRLRPEKDPGGIPKARAALIRDLVMKNEDAKAVIWLSEGPGEFELSLTSGNRLQLAGPENRIRIVYQSDSEVAENLWRHARQQALLDLHGEGGNDFTDNETLQVQLVPASNQNKCTRIKDWSQAEANKEQIIPLCVSWNVKVTLSEKSRSDLLVGGVILSSDGDIIGFPVDGRKELLKPGKSVVFKAKGEKFQGTLPLNVQDRLIVFGTQERNPVPWHLMTSEARTRSGSPAQSTLHRALERYITPGARGQKQSSDDVEDTTWTMTSVPMQVRANLGFAPPDPRSDTPTAREYTISNFDIRPYLPDNGESALYKVLKVADALSLYSKADGVGYKQHDWNKATDAENLKKGVDCSRAIWFAFTRAGLPYNKANNYISTADMVRANGPMKDYFKSCDGDPNLRIGDILVYRNPQKAEGHTVMVIDPEQRIAWGSHGWDGNAKELKVQPDTGVEYQLIKYKKDWERWDSKDMERQACWRYSQFAKESLTPRGQAGVEALGDPCDSNKSCSQIENDFYAKLKESK